MELEVTNQSKIEKFGPAILVLLCTIISFVIRISIFDYVFPDYVVFLSVWVDTIKENGFLSALQQPFYNYTPMYMYVLTLIAKLDVNALYGIKVVSIFFEYVIAFYIGRIGVLITKKKCTFWLAIAVVPLVPAAILNSTFMSQCDALYVAFILGSVYYLLKKKQFAAMIFLGIAFSLKSQTAIVLPFYFVYMLRGHIKWYMFLLIPVVYFITVIPVWIAGRPLLDLLTIYASQTNDSYVLASFIPNVYLWIYQFLDSQKIYGMVFVAVLVLVSGFLLSNKKYVFTLDAWIILLFLSSIVCPYFLPSMHERYIYLGDMCGLLYILINRKNVMNWIMALGIIFISFFSYAQCINYLSVFEWSSYPEGIFSFILVFPWKIMSIFYFGIIVYVSYDLIKTLKRDKDKTEFIAD